MRRGKNGGMTRLYLDFESRSEVPLELCGLDRYAKHSSTQVLLLAFAFDDGPVELWEPPEPFPPHLAEALNDWDVQKVAWNAGFERAIFHHVLGLWIPYDEWLDPSVLAKHMSMPGYLEEVGQILGLAPDQQKIAEGESLVQMFCVPAKVGGEKTLFGKSETVWRDKFTHPEDWERFREYCKNDVVAERAILKRLLPLHPTDRKGWLLDQKINDAGMPVDMELVRGAAKVAELAKSELRTRLLEITKLENPNSIPQMLGWLAPRGYTFGSLNKAFVARAAKECKLTPEGKEALELRGQLAKTSDSKLEAIANIVSEDGRLRNQFNYMGAARGGRWSGRDFQAQNLPRPVKAVEKKLDLALELLRAGDYLAIKREFPVPVMDVVSSCIRGVIQAPRGYKLVVCDLNAIENRVLGWLAGADSILDVFRNGLDPYVSFGVHLYGQPYDVLIKDKEKRQNAKPAVLGAGYRLGGGEEIENEDGDVVKTGLWGYAAAMGIELGREEAHRAVKVFRQTYPEVVQLWYDTERAAIRAVEMRQPQTVGHLTFEYLFKEDILRLLLPSGRGLHYLRPRVEDIAYGKYDPKPTLTFDGKDQTTKQWTRQETQGGKWVENACQAVARDVLLHGMLLADQKGLEIVLHAHDEIASLVPETSPIGLEDLRECMMARPEWAPGLPLGAEGYEGVYYKKG